MEEQVKTPIYGVKQPSISVSSNKPHPTPKPHPPKPAVCPITGEGLNPTNTIGFQINGKQVKVCSPLCKKKVIDLYHFLDGNKP